jgi:hypothetical protein
MPTSSSALQESSPTSFLNRVARANTTQANLVSLMAGSVKVRCEPDSSGKESARSASRSPMTAHAHAWTFSIAQNSFFIRRWGINSWTTTCLPARGASRRESAKEEEKEKKTHLWRDQPSESYQLSRLAFASERGLPMYL